MDNLSEKTILLYGLSDDRKKLFISLEKGKIKRNDVVIPEERGLQNYTVDAYNLELSDYLKRVVNELRGNHWWQEFLSKWYMKIPQKIPQLPLWQDYLYHLEKNDKNRLEVIYQGTKLIYGGPYYPGFILKRNEELITDFDLHIMRGCKIGIDIARTNPNVSIYFSIDELDMPSVFNKERFEGRLNATSSELRYVYRHWQELKEKVHFFKGKEEVPAPWVAGEYQKAWKRYIPWHEIKRRSQERQTITTAQPMFKEQEKVVNEYLKDHREQQSPRSFTEIRQQAIMSTPSSNLIKEQGNFTHEQLEK